MSAFGRVAIVGAGWAGLACAVELTAAGLPVTVIEASRQLGGRARALELEGHLLDNGQHLLVGAYAETLRLMCRVGAAPEDLFERTPLDLHYPARFRLTLPGLPAPLHLAAGLLAATGATMREKLSAALFMQRLKKRKYRLLRDISVAEWLDGERQQGAVRRFLWEPLCLAALNTTPRNASAQIFANVLRDSLGGGGEATDMLAPRTDLGRLFPDPAAAFITARGGVIRTSARVTRLQRAGNGWEIGNSASSVGNEHFDQIVLAVAPQHLPPLLVDRPAHEPLLRQLADYEYEPIGTAYLAYPEDLRLPSVMLGMPGPLGQWVFDRGTSANNTGILAFVLSADGDWDALADETLAANLHRELIDLLGPLPAPLWHRIIRERRATFSCRPQLARPGPETAERGLWLAGDYTYGDYPATIEGAVRSGVAAARGILA